MTLRPLHRLFVIGALAGALAEVQADEKTDRSAGPLSESKEGLKQLLKDQAVRGNEAAQGNLRNALPRLETPTPGAPPVSFTPPRERASAEAERKAQEQKNWLLDGVERLDETKRGRRPGDDADDRLAGAPSAADPDDLLRAYARRRAQADPAARGGNNDRSALLSGTADPLAPFMKDWLAGSPLDGKVLSDILGKPAGNHIGAVSADPDPALFGAELKSGTNTLASTAIGNGTETPPGRENPFLSALGPPDAGRTAPAPVSLPAPGVIGINGSAIPPSIATPPPSSQPVRNERKPPASPLEENRKYFPQQKRF